MFKARKGWAVNNTLLGGGWIACRKKLTSATHLVRVTDARELTAEQAVQRVLQAMFDSEHKTLAERCWNEVVRCFESCGWDAKLKRGRIVIRKART